MTDVKAERIEIATRLMEAWLKGPAAPTVAIGEIEAGQMVEICLKAALKIQTDS